MKKFLILSITILMSFSVFAFGGGKNQKMMPHNAGQIKMLGFGLDAKTLKEVGLKDKDISIVINLIKTTRLTLQKSSIETKQKDLEIKKVMLDEKKDWKKIEKLINEVSSIHSKDRLKLLKAKDTLSKYISTQQYQAIQRKMKNNFRNQQKKKFWQKKKNRNNQRKQENMRK